MIKPSSEPETTKVYKRRWFILFLYILFTAVGQFQWIEYTIITNIVMRYYNVSSFVVDWTAMVYMAAYPLFVIPASYLINKKGLRVAGLLGCLATALGVIIKLFSIGSDLMYVVLIGQSIVAISQLVVLPIPAKLAVTWFPEKEVSRACALGVFGMQLGCALGFIIPPTIVKNHENVEDIGHDLNILCWILTAVIVPVAITMIIYFPNKPKLPPNNIKEADDKYTLSVFYKSLKDLFTDYGFIIHLLPFSISVGAYNVIGSLLNQFVLEYFENAQEDAGRMGLIMVLTGTIATPIVGIILDKTHAFKLACLVSMFMEVVGMGLLMFALETKVKLLVYIAFGVLGIFLNTYLPAGIEFAIELTYPATESTTTGILFAMCQVCGFLWTLGSSQIVKKFGTIWALGVILGVMALGTIITIFTPNKLKRQDNFKSQSLKSLKSSSTKDLY